MESTNNHLVISVAGGPLSFVYGTKDASPEQLAKELREIFDETKPASIEIICIDACTDTPYTPSLDKGGRGLVRTKYKGSGWRARFYFKPEQGGKIIAGFHEYCASASTNLNNGEWRKDVSEQYANMAITVIKKTFPELTVEILKYHKVGMEGEVEKSLQELTRVPYSF